MKNIIIYKETYDTDEIIAFEFVLKHTLKISMTGDRRHYLPLEGSNEKEYKKDFDRYFKEYQIAIEKRKKGELSDLEIEDKIRHEEHQKIWDKYYNQSSSSETDNLPPSSFNDKVNEQESLFN